MLIHPPWPVIIYSWLSSFSQEKWNQQFHCWTTIQYWGWFVCISTIICWFSFVSLQVFFRIPIKRMFESSWSIKWIKHLLEKVIFNNLGPTIVWIICGLVLLTNVFWSCLNTNWKIPYVPYRNVLILKYHSN